jgi:uncharacterized protein YecT (DUF1311 family)
MKYITRGLTALVLMGTFTYNAATAQQCPKVKLSDFPKEDQPSAVVSAKVKNDSTQSGDYYYGIGRPVDYKMARYVALKEFAVEIASSDEAMSRPFDGASVLMMLYANGYGVKRNISLAIRLACAHVGGAKAEVKGRLGHLNDMMQSETPDSIDICDDITSGYMMGMCYSLLSKKADIERTAATNDIIKNWPQQGREAFAKLRTATSAYIGALTSNEVDISGTARAMEVGQEHDSLEDRFLEDLKLMNNGTFPKYGPVDFNAADKKLNLVYQKIRGIKDFDNDTNGTIRKEGIKTTERAWIAYRDAWVAFAAIQFPAVTPDAIHTYFTKQRTAQLTGFLPE